MLDRRILGFSTFLTLLPSVGTTATLNLSKPLLPQCRTADRAKLTPDEIMVCDGVGRLNIPRTGATGQAVHSNSERDWRRSRPSAEAMARKAPPDTQVEQSQQDDDRCIPQKLFIRADPIDNFWYGVSPGAGDAKGASISYTNDHLAGTQTATVNGLVSYLLKKYCSNSDDVALAIWTSANGSWNEPLKKGGTDSTLRVGPDLQYRHYFGNYLLTDLYFDFRPYSQTDFRWQERAEGANLAIEPVVPSLWLGQGAPFSDYFSAFWALRAEADFVEVSDRGTTNLVAGRYDWFGGTLRAYMNLFVTQSGEHHWQPWLADRFSIVGSAQYFWDSRSSTEIRKYTAALQYKLGVCKKDNTDKTNPDCVISGSSSISFEYDWGTDKDTLVNVNQYLVKLNYSY